MSAYGLKSTVAKLGGSLKSAWLTFGDYDTVVLVEMPDDVSAAAFAMAISAGGSCSAVKTTPLVSVEDGITAMKKRVVQAKAVATK